MLPVAQRKQPIRELAAVGVLHRHRLGLLEGELHFPAAHRPLALADGDRRTADRTVDPSRPAAVRRSRRGPSRRHCRVPGRPRLKCDDTRNAETREPEIPRRSRARCRQSAVCPSRRLPARARPHRWRLASSSGVSYHRVVNWGGDCDSVERIGLTPSHHNDVSIKISRLGLHRRRPRLRGIVLRR